MSIELKKYIVVGGENGLPEIWHTETYRDVDKNNPEHFKGYRIITTFNADEQLTEPLQPVPAGEWISVEPGNPLPGIDEAVLWFTEDGNQWVDSLDKDESFADFKRHTSVTHWRPLPAPPSPKQEDKQ